MEAISIALSPCIDTAAALGSSSTSISSAAKTQPVGKKNKKYK
jgi:hypothetical protein